MKRNFFKVTAVLMLTLVAITSCKKKEKEEEMVSNLMTSTYNYEFNNGQVIASAAYDGAHNDMLKATMKVMELSETQSMITVTLTNTINGEMYMVHAHDAADPSTTPNGTPYNESPNSNVFTQMATGNGGSITLSQTVNMSYNAITTSYDGFLVVHDPLQAINTQDVSTYLVVGSFARTQSATNYSRSSFMYDFNTGQVDPSFAYNGMHPTNLMGEVYVQELGDGTSRISVSLANTVDGEMYMIHSHDAADPATTPNGTPYDETPNANVCVLMATGNGGTVMASQKSTLSYTDITQTYNGFFVVHDPLQAVSTTDPTTYVLLGLFAR